MNPLTLWRNFWTKHQFSRDIIWGFTEFILVFIISRFTVTGIHEWLHLWATQELGGDGYIIKSIFGAGVIWTTRPEYPMIVAFAGGVGVATIFGIRIIMDWHDDITEAAALMPIFCSQLVYGIVEGLFILDAPVTFEKYAQTSLAVGSTNGFLIAVVMMLMWLVRLSKKYDKKSG